ncbi:ABC transporter permease [Streptomyces zagrosensis]|uniref:Peptide/nickel transport system permease protein n=1 Tax=Streptomyces zagrosensis TaxID=1042984 RepID=A0A7W9Q9K2_9ACTN|nr:ABC transporter permease [Streptomyces zagrosensis]MBB5935889.1 peptide/nickel transport system permease protein [Streptomyces zagrosensis]
MTAPLHDTSAAETAAVDVAADAPAKEISGRSPAQIAWVRLKRDKIALAGGCVVLFLVLVAIFAPLIVDWFGHPPNEFHDDEGTVDSLLGGQPVGDWGGMSKDFLFGVEPVNGRDTFSRVVYGTRISLIVAFLAAIFAVLLGTIFGVIAGYFGGIVDTVISRTMDLLLAFPQLLFILSLVSVVPAEMWGLSGSGVRIGVLIVVIGFFGWPYVGRIVRGQTLSLREREYVEAAQSLGAGRRYILFKELLPNLVAPITVYMTLMIPTNILTEAALSFLGAGVTPPTASWGQMLSTAVRTYEIAPMFMIFPGLAIFVTVLAFNLFGDGVRDALDPKGSR